MTGEEIKLKLMQLENELNALAEKYNLIYDIDVTEFGKLSTGRYTRVYIKANTSLR